MSKRYDEPIEVEVSGPGAPAAFVWRGRSYRVETVIKRWLETSEGWDPDRATSRDCFRVESRGGIYDLHLDRLAGRKQPQWRLARVWD